MNLFISMLYSKNQTIKGLYNNILFEYLNPEIISFMWRVFLVDKDQPTLNDLEEYGFDLTGLGSNKEISNRLDRVIGTESGLKIWYEVLIEENLEPLISLVVEEIGLFDER